jgi:HAD superfamily hydrolase (TIGR01509 family)
MRAVIFDMDGVIVDSEPIYEQHLQAFLIKLGVSQPELLQVNLKGVSARDTSIVLIDTFKLTYEVDELVTLGRKAYLEHLESIEKLPSIPGVIAFIKYLSKSGYSLALASSASARRIDLFLSKLNLKRYFPVIISADDVTRSKPAPDIFLLAAKKLGVTPGNCVVIEDSQNGVLAAQAAGMKCIAYAGSDHNTDDLSAADIIIKDFKALTKSLKYQTLPV